MAGVSITDHGIQLTGDGGYRSQKFRIAIDIALDKDLMVLSTRHDVKKMVLLELQDGVEKVIEEVLYGHFR